MENKFCFVIQPFHTPFDKRYDEIYVPAIRAAGLEPYRVDRDPAAKILIEQIETKITESQICFADISIDNPNVWYELGYAFASKKDVVMVCNKQRDTFPFDIRHKSVIPYTNDSPSDFKTLESQITDKIVAYLNQPSYKYTSISVPLQQTQGLQAFEAALLAIIVGEQKTDHDSATIYTICQRMNNAGYNDTGISIGLRCLKSKGLIECFIDQDWNGNEYNACRLTEAGEKFILSNINLFELSLTKTIIKSPDSLSDISNELPF